MHIMASQPSRAKTLTKTEQKRTIKGIQKSRKNVVKNTLKSPFSLDWPIISPEHEKEVLSLLKISCSGLKKITCKPPWKEVAKFKGAERKAFLKEYRQNFQENLDPDVQNQNKETEESVSHLIFGYNAVMRALEKDRIVGVLVKKNVEPVFLVKTFLPGCANKCIPLVPLDDLDCILKSEETLALSHACMVLGLKPSVKDERNKFYQLYVKMCEAVQVEVDDDTDEEVEENMECSTEEPAAEDENENKILTSSFHLTDEQIQSYHLKRTDKKKRVFIPGGKQEQDVETLGSESDFIGLGSTEAEVPEITDKFQIFNRKYAKKSNTARKKSSIRVSKIIPKDAKKQQICSNDPEVLDFNSMFVIDDTGNQEGLPEKEENVKPESSNLNLNATAKEKKLGEKKPKKRKSGLLPYVPAKTKRVKNNPNRKKKQ